MNKLISNENGVMWIETESGETFGIVSSIEILDEDGLKFSDDTFKVLEIAGVELEQDFENQKTSFETDQGVIEFENLNLDAIYN